MCQVFSLGTLAKQFAIAKEILGLRTSTESVGALPDLGCADVETKAAKSRLLFWWLLRHTHLELMRQLEPQAHEPALHELTGEQLSH